MELYSRVRRACHVGGMSERAAAGHFGIDRKTVSKILKHSVPPGYRREHPPVRPKLDPFIPIINQILEEDKSRIKKQRHTARRIYERLRDEHGFTGGITIVTDYVREKKRRTREVFVPLVHAPGHAQVDFGEALGEIGGVVRKLHYFAMALPHSDAFFIKALSGGDNRGLLRWPCSWLCVLRRRAVVRALRQHHDRGGADPRGRKTATHQNLCRVAVALSLRGPVRPSWQGQRVSYWNAIGPRDNGER